MDGKKREAQKWPAGVARRWKIKWISFRNLPMTLESLLNKFIFIFNFFMFKFYDFSFSLQDAAVNKKRRKLKTNSGNNSKHLQVKTVFFFPLFAFVSSCNEIKQWRWRFMMILSLKKTICSFSTLVEVVSECCDIRCWRNELRLKCNQSKIQEREF